MQTTVILLSPTKNELLFQKHGLLYVTHNVTVIQKKMRNNNFGGKIQNRPPQNKRNSFHFEFE